MSKMPFHVDIMILVCPQNGYLDSGEPIRLD